MADTTITPTEILRDTDNAITPIAIVHGNRGKIPVTGKDDIFLFLNNTTAATKEVTFTAGDFGARSILGDLVVSMVQDSHKVIHLESSRFLNSADNCYYLEYEASMTGWQWAIVAH